MKSEKGLVQRESGRKRLEQFRFGVLEDKWEGWRLCETLAG